MLASIEFFDHDTAEFETTIHTQGILPSQNIHNLFKENEDRFSMKKLKHKALNNKNIKNHIHHDDRSNNNNTILYSTFMTEKNIKQKNCGALDGYYFSVVATTSPVENQNQKHQQHQQYQQQQPQQQQKLLDHANTTITTTSNTKNYKAKSRRTNTAIINTNEENYEESILAEECFCQYNATKYLFEIPYLIIGKKKFKDQQEQPTITKRPTKKKRTKSYSLTRCSIDSKKQALYIQSQLIGLVKQDKQLQNYF